MTTKTESTELVIPGKLVSEGQADTVGYPVTTTRREVKW